MKKKPRNPRARTAARVVQRSEQKVQGLREKLAQLEPGGSPQQPLVVVSASVIEPRAESLTCPRCEGHMRAESHESSGEAERVVRLVCRACGAQRSAYFRIAPPLPN